MKKKLFMALALSLGVCAFTGVANAQWLETFDNYSIGPLAAQSTWEEWYTSTNVDADVSSAFAFSGTKSVKIHGTPDSDDVVYPFSTLPGGRPDSGAWLIQARTYAPSSEVGLSYFIMLNTYNDASTGPDNWSLQVRFNETSSMVRNDGASKTQAPLLRDQWGTLRAWIDLTGDKVHIFYNDSVLAKNESWVNGISGGGIARIDVVDLYGGQGSNAATGIYYDNLSLAPADAYGVVLNANPDPVSAGKTITLTTMGPTLGGSQAALFVWDVNGFPHIQLLAVNTLGIDGKWALSGPVPPGLGGLNINFRSLVVGPAGGTVSSNLELVVFK